MQAAPTASTLSPIASTDGCTIGAPDIAVAEHTARADDPIGQWLKQDEADGQDDEVRPDLNALTDQQLRDIFKVWPEQADSPELIERGRQEPILVLYIWLIAIVAGFGVVIGAVKIGPFPRSHLRTLVIPVQMKGQSY